MTPAQSKYMLDRFLSWNLPRNFTPDSGISFEPKSYHDKMPPTGTNLFDAAQAAAMIAHMTDGLPAAEDAEALIAANDDLNATDVLKMAQKLMDVAMDDRNLPRRVVGVNLSYNARIHQIRTIGAAMGMTLHGIMNTGGDTAKRARQAFDAAWANFEKLKGEEDAKRADEEPSKAPPYFPFTGV